MRRGRFNEGQAGVHHRSKCRDRRGLGDGNSRGNGARLLLCARRVERLQAMDAELRDAGAADVFSFQLDVQSREAVEAAMGAAAALRRGAVDVLVNNAGLSRGLKKLYEDDVQDWEEMIDTNIKGLLYVTRMVVPGMVERGDGHVINLGSIAGHIVYPNGAVYCATKAAELFISDGLRIDLNGTPVRVTSIDPGMAETEFSIVRFRVQCGACGPRRMKMFMRYRLRTLPTRLCGRLRGPRMWASRP